MRSPPQRSLGFCMCTALVVGNMIGSGVFLLPSSLAPYGGISLLGWLFTCGGSILLALVFARLSKLVPKAGGPYAYTRAGFGDLAGFLVAWGYWISIMAGNAGIAVAFAGYLAVFWPAIASTPLLAGLVALSAIWLLTFVNAAGVRHAGWLQLITTILKLLPLVAIGLFGLFYFKVEHFTFAAPQGDSLFGAVTATAALTLWAFLGFESATVPAEDVVEPEKTIPRATILGTLAASLVYVFSTVAVMGIIPAAQLANSSAPFADAASAIWGSWAKYLVGGGAAISCFGTLNGWLLMQGQVPMAAARDHLLPHTFGRESNRGTPALGLVISSILVTVLVALNYTRSLVQLFTFIILLSTMTALLPYTFSTLAETMILIRQRQKFEGRRLARPAILGGAAFTYALWALAGSGKETVFWGFLLVMAGVPVYVWQKWKQTENESTTK